MWSPFLTIKRTCLDPKDAPDGLGRFGHGRFQINSICLVHKFIIFEFLTNFQFSGNLEIDECVSPTPEKVPNRDSAIINGQRSAAQNGQYSAPT